jgi:hypothetical protein
MPFDPVSALRKIQKRVDALRMKPAWVAGAGEFSRSILSEAASGQNPLSYPISRKIERTLDACEVLQIRAGNFPIDWANSIAVRKLIADYEMEQQNPPGDLTTDDWSLLSNVLASTDPAAPSANLGLTPSELLKRLVETNRRFEAAIETIRRSNEDKHALVEIVNDEVEARRIARQS